LLWAVYIHYLGDKEKIFIASNVYGKFKVKYIIQRISKSF